MNWINFGQRNKKSCTISLIGPATRTGLHSFSQTCVHVFLCLWFCFLSFILSSQDEMVSRLLSARGCACSKLVVVAVANTMDLPERVLAHRVASRLGLTRITFAPYTRLQLATIIANRLTPHAVFQPDAIELCARKIAASSGDARRALDICRRAAELALNGVVDIRTVNQALQDMTASPVIAAIASASQHEQLFLKTITTLFQKSGVEETTFGEIATQHLEQCRFMSLPAPSVTSLAKLCTRLSASRICIVESGDQDIHQRIRLNYPVADVVFALQSDAGVT
eukprot:m.146447 g.146447  ORF g.146447 m.146447 type:complete len:282 (+) comp52711_c0_seq2:1301-2146(+)